MFPSKKQTINGFTFGQRTWYTKNHLGVDYKGKIGDIVYAPFDGEVITQLKGEQGGLTVWFKPKHDDVIMRFMHLSKFGKKGKVKEGDIIGYVGNTGKATTGPHLHLDISKKTVQITKFANFLDPEKYDWSSKAKKEPKKEKKVKVVQDTINDIKIVSSSIPSVSLPISTANVKVDYVSEIKKDIEMIDHVVEANGKVVDNSIKLSDLPKIEDIKVPEFKLWSETHPEFFEDKPFWKRILNIIKLWTKKQ